MTVPPVPDLAQRLAEFDRRAAGRRTVVDTDKTVRTVWIVYGVLIVVIGILLGAFIVKLFG